MGVRRPRDVELGKKRRRSPALRRELTLRQERRREQEAPAAELRQSRCAALGVQLLLP